MRFFKKNDIYCCVLQGASISCLLGIGFTKNSDNNSTTTVAHHFKVDRGNWVPSDEVWRQVQNAVAEKEIEYKTMFVIDTIEYIDNDHIPHEQVYYEFTKLIIDRMMKLSEYEGRD